MERQHQLIKKLPKSFSRPSGRSSKTRDTCRSRFSILTRLACSGRCLPGLTSLRTNSEHQDLKYRRTYLTARGLSKDNKNLLHVPWMHNPKITNILLLNWFHKCFIPQPKEYLQNTCMEFRVLLIMDNSSGNSLDLNHEGVQVEFFPANAPLTSSMICSFKAL